MGARGVRRPGGCALPRAREVGYTYEEADERGRLAAGELVDDLRGAELLDSVGPAFSVAVDSPILRRYCNGDARPSPSPWYRRDQRIDAVLVADRHPPTA